MIPISSVNRREFLKTVSAGAATAAISASSSPEKPGPAAREKSAKPSPSPAGADRPPLGGFRDRGAWFWSPSYLEPLPGPWAEVGQFGAEAVPYWRAAIDWFAERGVNLVCTCLPTNNDSSASGWGFHYVLDFKKYPESRALAESEVRRNQEVLREVTAYARAKGVATYIQHYCFAATFNFLDAHPELWTKIKKHSGFRHLDQNWHVAGNVCWFEPLYRDWMVECYREYFELFPDASGVMVTLGEAANCGCPRCVGKPTLNYGETFRRKEKVDMLADFVRVFVKTLSALGKRPLVRVWGNFIASDPYAIEAFPKGATYVPKYSVFDAIDSGPDPLVKAWIGAGHDVVVSKSLTGGNAGPVVWCNPQYVHRVVAESRAAGASGFISIEGNGFVSPILQTRAAGEKTARQIAGPGADRVSPVWAGNLAASARYISHDEPYNDAPWIAYFRKIFGAAGGEKVFQAVQLYSQLTLAISRVIYTASEGYQWFEHYPFRAPHDIALSMAPPDYALQGAMSLKAMVQFLAESPWSESVLETLAMTRETPISLLGRVIGRCEEAMRRLDEVEPLIPETARFEFTRVKESALLNALGGKQWRHLLIARAALAGTTGPAGGAQQRHAARVCLEEFQKSIDAMEAQKKPMELLYPGGIDGMDKRIGQRTAELTELREEFADLLSGKTDRYTPPPPKPVATSPKSKPSDREEEYRKWREMKEKKVPKTRQT